MMKLINRMQLRDQRGFTLIELLIVVAIIAILAAIAIPQYNKYRLNAAKASVQSDAKNCLNTLMAEITASLQAGQTMTVSGWSCPLKGAYTTTACAVTEPDPVKIECGGTFAGTTFTCSAAEGGTSGCY